MVPRAGYFDGGEHVPYHHAFPAASHQAIGKMELLHAIADRIIAQHDRAGNPASATPPGVQEMAS